MEKLMTEKAEKLNGWAAMLGFIVAIGTYATTLASYSRCILKVSKIFLHGGKLAHFFLWLISLRCLLILLLI